MIPRWSTSRLAALVLCLAACDETQRASYATYEAAAQAGAVQRGWIPSFVPQSAIEMTEAHDLDLNTQRLRFRIPLGDVPRMTAGMEPLPLAEASAPSVRSPALSGDWPEELTTPGQAPRASLRLYRASATGADAHCLAVELDRGMVYVWSCERAT